jgi:F-type H+-transporting ATPase subunit b
MTQMPLSVALLAAAGGGLTDVDLTLTVSTFVLFLIFAFVLGRFGWKPLLKMIEEREKGIREAVEGAERANAEAQAALEKHREMLREAGREREEILKRAFAESDQLRQELVGKARAESEQALQRARDQIERDKSAAIQELRAQVADIAMEAAAKIVTSSLTPETQRKLVDDYIAGLPKAQ